ncbi:FtsX-like permease family protein [Halalkalibacterium halodurans]|uniref:FtsX-like permease family protein n=1 Tax=Halalkalibacterium halodurans TaxID=86665 RepID=UPI002AA9F5D5|nr:FtsX-like permease family protein [Halalkalibacterium halodurans]MDY7220785.1 FtsX-like permease family protein [Halalkalibacterium halodurans]MDY7240024.1 FtsX-like permease family protein [Halalkalibacterium halodurans]
MSFNHIVIQNIVRDKWTYISYFLSSVFSILVFFFFLITAFHPMMDAIDANSSLGIAMILCSMIVYIFSFIFIIYSMLAFLKKKTKSLGVFIISGASTKQVRKMVFRENMLIAFAAIITAIVVGLIVSPLFLMVVKNILEAESFGMYVPVQAIATTFILFSVLFFIVSKITTRFIKKEEAVQLLKADVTQEKLILPTPWRFLLSILVSAVCLLPFKVNPDIIESLGILYFVILFISLLITFYLVLTQGTWFTIRGLQKSSSYYRKTNMLFVSNLQAKGKSHAHIIYLLSILLLAVFVTTSVLYSSYYNVEENTEAVYPYSFQYISHPDNPIEKVQQDIEFIESTIEQIEGDFDTYQSAFKTDEGRRIGFMSNTNFNALGTHQAITLNDNEYYVVAGNVGMIPNTDTIQDYVDDPLQYVGLEEGMILTTGFRAVYYVIPDAIYEALNYPEYHVFAYELKDWTEKRDVAEKIESQIMTEPDERYVTSKISLYHDELFVKRIMFFIGFMLSLLFLSAAMSILYFYLQTSLAGEKEKYLGIRKIGLSMKEMSVIVTRELSILIFVPFTIATILLFIVLFSIRDALSPAFFQMTNVGLGIILLLFTLSFLIIRKAYLKKLVE